MTVKQIRFVEAQANPLKHVAEVSAVSASPTTPGLVKQAAHVDEASGTVADLVDALVAAGIMAAK